MINYPVLGEINVYGLNEFQLANKIKVSLIEGGHLTDPYVKVKKFCTQNLLYLEKTLEHEFNFYQKRLNLFSSYRLCR